MNIQKNLKVKVLFFLGAMVASLTLANVSKALPSFPTPATNISVTRSTIVVQYSGRQSAGLRLQTHTLPSGRQIFFAPNNTVQLLDQNGTILATGSLAGFSISNEKLNSALIEALQAMVIETLAAMDAAMAQVGELISLIQSLGTDGAGYAPGDSGHTGSGDTGYSWTYLGSYETDGGHTIQVFYVTFDDGGHGLLRLDITTDDASLVEFTDPLPDTPDDGRQETTDGPGEDGAPSEPEEGESQYDDRRDQGNGSTIQGGPSSQTSGSGIWEGPGGHAPGLLGQIFQVKGFQTDLWTMTARSLLTVPTK